MKLQITMKTPDALDEAIKEQIENMEFDYSQDEDERNVLRKQKKEELKETASKWFKYGEVVTLEIDTVAKTCIVLPK